MGACFGLAGWEQTGLTGQSIRHSTCKSVGWTGKKKINKQNRGFLNRPKTH